MDKSQNQNEEWRKQAAEGSSVWWLILCVNLAGPWCPEIWSNITLDEINIWIGDFE